MIFATIFDEGRRQDLQDLSGLTRYLLHPVNLENHV
jgi:hypothetical protein